jgi:hypothetical protein
MYIGAGLSMANSKGQAFDVTSYPSIEFGITRSNLSYGLVLGRGNLIGLAQSGDVLSNYFYEVKVSPSFPIGIVNANIILGVGSYFITSNAMFIEYGIGVSKSYGNLTYGVSYTIGMTLIISHQAYLTDSN